MTKFNASIQDEGLKRIAGQMGGSSRQAQEESGDYRSYWDNVEETAQWVKDNYKDYGGNVHDALNESVESDRWVFITWKAHKTMEHTANEDALWDQMGSMEADSWSQVVTQAAFFALSQDITDKMFEMGWDGGESWGEDDEDEEY